MDFTTSAPRRKTRQIMVGNVPVGGDAPITVQSMTITKTADVEGTLQQIYALAAAGADIVRCTCNEMEAAEGLAQIVPRSPGADRRRHPPPVQDGPRRPRRRRRTACGSTRATSAGPSTSRPWPRSAKDRGVPIRIGVNGGVARPEALREVRRQVTPEAMVESAQQELAYFDEVGFDDVKISVKASNVPLMIEAYRQLSEATDYPLHLGRHRGRSAAGRPDQGHGRHRHAPGRGHRRHHPLLAHRRPRRGGAGRPPAPRSHGAAGAQGRRPDRLPVVRAGRGRRDRGGQGRHGGLR